MGKYGNFLVFWASQTVSQLGSAMTSFALIIWAYKQTGSALTVSLLAFFSYLPYILVSAVSGTVVDRCKKKSILLLADCGAAACTGLTVLLFLSGTLQVWHVYAVNAVIGAMNAFQSPAAFVAVGLMVPENKLSTASGLNSFSASLLGVVAPVLASSLISLKGLGAVLLLDLCSFAFAFFVLCAFIRIPEQRAASSHSGGNFLSDAAEGFRFLLSNRGLLYLILSMAVMNFFSRLTYENILPAMILARSAGSDRTLGLVSAVLGAGGIIGGLLVSLFKLPRDTVKTIYLAAWFSFTAGDLLMGLSRGPLLWCVAGLAASIPLPFIEAAQNVIMYGSIPKPLQGRVFAARNALQYCAIPLGILLGGLLADKVFEPLMRSGSSLTTVLGQLVGTGEGSGMAAMFLCTGVLGGLASIAWYSTKGIKGLRAQLLWQCSNAKADK